MKKLFLIGIMLAGSLQAMSTRLFFTQNTPYLTCSVQNGFQVKTGLYNSNLLSLRLNRILQRATHTIFGASQQRDNFDVKTILPVLVIGTGAWYASSQPVTKISAEEKQQKTEESVWHTKEASALVEENDDFKIVNVSSILSRLKNDSSAFLYQLEQNVVLREKCCHYIMHNYTAFSANADNAMLLSRVLFKNSIILETFLTQLQIHFQNNFMQTITTRQGITLLRKYYSYIRMTEDPQKINACKKELAALFIASLNDVAAKLESVVELVDFFYYAEAFFEDALFADYKNVLQEFFDKHCQTLTLLCARDRNGAVYPFMRMFFKCNPDNERTFAKALFEQIDTFNDLHHLNIFYTKDAKEVMCNLVIQNLTKLCNYKKLMTTVSYWIDLDASLAQPFINKSTLRTLVTNPGYSNVLLQSLIDANPRTEQHIQIIKKSLQ